MSLLFCALASLLAALCPAAVAGEAPLVAQADAGPFQVLAQTSQADADQVAALLRQQVAVIGDFVPELRPAAGARFRVLLLRDRGELQRFLSHRGVSGGSTFCYVHHADWRRRRIIGYVVSGERLARGLTHELVHALLHARVARPPVWLDEGLAEWLELAVPSKGEADRPPVNTSWLRLLPSALPGARRGLSVSSLLALRDDEFGPRSRVAYPLSWALCEVLGRDRLRVLVRGLGPTATAAENRATVSAEVRAIAPLVDWEVRLARLSRETAQVDGSHLAQTSPRVEKE